MKKFILPFAAALALAGSAIPATASTDKVCKPFNGTSHYEGCEKALNTAVDQLNESLATTGKIKVNAKAACADMSKKKDKALGNKKPFNVCKKVIKKWAKEIPPPPSS